MGVVSHYDGGNVAQVTSGSMSDEEWESFAALLTHVAKGLFEES